MHVVIHHPNGNIYRIPAQQFVCYTGGGAPLSLAYEHNGLVVQCDVQDPDFTQTLALMRVDEAETPDV